jgi:hypothetical protein
MVEGLDCMVSKKERERRFDKDVLHKEEGGFFNGFFNYGTPFVVLRIYKDKIRIRIPFLAVLEFKKEEIDYIERFFGLFSKGINIAQKNKHGRTSVVFWSMNVERLVAELKKAGYNVR